MSKKQSDVPAPQETESGQGASNGSATQTIANTLGAHKGKLAIGVAASLGLMVFYKWRERQLAKSDPEDYARLQRLKANVNHKLEESPEEDKHKPVIEPHVMRKARKEKDPDAA